MAWQIGRVRPEDWVSLAYGIAPALLLLPVALSWPRWPVRMHEQSYRIWAGAPMVIALLVWVLGVSLSNDGDAAPWPTLPMLDPLDLTVIGVFAIAARWWHELSDAQRAEVTPAPTWALPAVVAGVVFVWLNSAMLRGLHYTIGTPLSAYGIRHSAIVQAGFSIFWGGLGFAAMLFAARRHQREMWIAGAGLMIVVAIKLFLVDTAGTGTLARIVAFLIVGALLLVTGYLAPLPPPREEADSASAR
jgi:uncharacterized membrane protein